MKKTTIAFIGFATVLVANPVGLRSEENVELRIADFESLGLAPETWWVGDTADEDYSVGKFRSGSFEFVNFYMPEYGSWAFYGYSDLTSTEYTGVPTVENQMKNCVGGGYKSDTFGVCYCDSFWGPASVTLPDYETVGVNVNGMWLTNTAWVEDAILNGDGMSGPFETGDFLKVIAKGYMEDEEKPEEVEFYLADFRSENTEEHYYLKEWRYFDLSELGEVSKIVFSMTSSKVNSYGPTTPMYFAFDDLGALEDETNVAAIGGDDFAVNIEIAGNMVNIICEIAIERVIVTGLSGIANIVENPGCTVYGAFVDKGINIISVETSLGVKTFKVICR